MKIILPDCEIAFYLLLNEECGVKPHTKEKKYYRNILYHEISLSSNDVSITRHSIANKDLIHYTVDNVNISAPAEISNGHIYLCARRTRTSTCY